MAEIEIISRPKPQDKAPEIEIISRPKPVEQPAPPAVEQSARPGAVPPQPRNPSFGQRLRGNYDQMRNQGSEAFRRGMERQLQDIRQNPNPGIGMRPGMGDIVSGALQYAGSPITAAARTIVGDPLRNAARGAGAPEWAAEILGGTGELGGEFVGGAAAPKLVREGAAAIKNAPAALNEAATAAGSVGRKAINTVDDVVNSLVDGVKRRQAEKAATAAPSKDVLKVAGGGELQAAKTLGGDIRPEVFQQRVANIRPGLAAADVDLRAEELYDNTRGLINYLERRTDDIRSFKDLMTIQREAREYVKQAQKAAISTGSKSDFRGAQIVSKNLDEFINDLQPEDMMPGADPKAAQEALRVGKELWKRNAKMGEIEDVVEIAKDLGKPEYVKQQFERLVKDGLDNYTPAERDLIKKIARMGTRDIVDDVMPTLTGAIPGANAAMRAGQRLARDKIRENRVQELLDLIARGEGAQAEKAATKAAQPSFSERVGKVLRPEPPNSRNRR